MSEKGSEAGRRLASMRRVHKKVCPVCGTEFEGIARRVYDRPSCQVKAYRQRKKQVELGRASS
jgi:tRNA(Ile2) C34 agmatinyltransferase TiaS